MAETFTVRLALVARRPSETWRPTRYVPGVMPHDAATAAETVPLLFVRPDTVRPAGMLGAVTVRLPAGV